MVNGIIYGIPLGSNYALIYNPESNKISSSEKIPSPIDSGDSQWAGGVAVNGIIYGIPCDSNYALIYNPPGTSSPTTSPTTSPTMNPTMSPTVSLTAEPTSPTTSPTISPTMKPTMSPTAESTSAVSPTTKPTTSPTALPTVTTALATIQSGDDSPSSSSTLSEGVIIAIVVVVVVGAVIIAALVFVCKSRKQADRPAENRPNPVVPNRALENPGDPTYEEIAGELVGADAPNLYEEPVRGNEEHEKRHSSIEPAAKSTYHTADTGAPRPDPRLDPMSVPGYYQ